MEYLKQNLTTAQIAIVATALMVIIPFSIISALNTVERLVHANPNVPRAAEQVEVTPVRLITRMEFVEAHFKTVNENKAFARYEYQVTVSNYSAQPRKATVYAEWVDTYGNTVTSHDLVNNATFAPYESRTFQGEKDILAPRHTLVEGFRAVARMSHITSTNVED